MPIVGISDKTRLQKVGRIRLGHRELVMHKGPEKKAIYRPVADPFFVLTDAPAVADVAGDNPTSLRIIFLSDNMEKTFPHYLRRYSARGLRCMGDGQTVMYHINDDGIKDVNNGLLCNDKGVTTLFPVGDSKEKTQARAMPCAGLDCPFYATLECKPTGYLRFALADMPRQGYLDLVCHQRATIGIKTSLELSLSTFGRLTGIPFILHRGDEESVQVRTKDGKTQAMLIRVPWLEVDPAWYLANVSRTTDILVESAKRRQLQAQLARVSLFGEEPGENVKLLEAAIQEFENESFEGEKAALDEDSDEVVEGTAEVVEDPPIVAPGAKPVAPPKLGDKEQLQPTVAPLKFGDKEYPRPATPDQVREYLNHQVRVKFPKWVNPAPPSERGEYVNKVNRAAGNWGAQGRHWWSFYQWGEESSKKLSFGQVEATKRWLDPERIGKGHVDPTAQTEFAAMLTEACKAKGQLTLPLESPETYVETEPTTQTQTGDLNPQGSTTTTQEEDTNGN